MTNKIYVSDNGIKREATIEEIEQFKKDQEERLLQQKLLEEELNAKAAARAAILARLGLTEEEVRVLLG